MRATASYPLVTLDPKTLLLHTWTIVSSHDLCLRAVLRAILHMTPLVMIDALSAGGDCAANGVGTSSRFSAERAGFMAMPSDLGGRAPAGAQGVAVGTGALECSLLKGESMAALQGRGCASSPA